MEAVQNKVGIDELYKFAKTLIKAKNIPYDEDLIQDMVVSASRKAKYFDSTKSKKSTFFMMIMWQTFLLKERINKTRQGQFEKNTVNLNQSVTAGGIDDDEVELMDMVASNDGRNSKWTQKIFSIIEPMLSEDLKLQMAGYTQTQIARIKKVSQAQVCRNIAKNIKEIQAKLSEGDMLNYYKAKFMKSYFN